MSFCTKCGNQLKPNASFCGVCGNAVKPASPQVKQNSILNQNCKTCGTQLTKELKFCIVCGSPNSSVLSEKPLIPVSPPKSTNRPIPETKNNQNPVSNKKRRILAIAGLSLIMLALACGTAWFFLKEKTHINNEEEIVRPEYKIHPTIAGTTTEEIKEVNAKIGSNVSLVFSDSSSVSFFDIASNAKVVLKKEKNNIKPDLSGIESSGYMLSLNVQLKNNADVTEIKPLITISQSQVGEINPATINIIRISDITDDNGNVIHNQIQFLPVTRNKSGNYEAIDCFFALTTFSPNSNATVSENVFDRIGELFISKAMAQNPAYNSEMTWVANVKYCLVTFQGHINWKKNPLLVQMTPDSHKAYFRHPATKDERMNSKQPVTNIIVMVHGHNEEEKGGYVENRENGIWEFGYKRDVWNYMYQFYLEEQEKALKADKNKPGNCTLFYEFIYPSFRPIYSPVPINSIIRHQTLGEDLGEALNKELLENNPQIARMIKENIPFNLFIVGHSMGGLVARAGLRSLDPKLLANFRQLITWGSPHQGSPVTTLRYITAAGFDISIDGLPFYPYGDYPSDIMRDLALDTPGTRDLRWTNGSKGFERFFDYDKYFRGNSFTDRLNPNKWDLRTGTVFYNDNLRAFNESEKFADKYTFFTGNTSKMAEVKKCNFLLTKAYYLLVKASDCAKGSYIIKLLAGDDSFRDNDGASPVYGQGGFGLFPRPRVVDLGDIDHEEFYEGKGNETAARTYWEMNRSIQCNCPYISDYKYNEDTISAKLIIPPDPFPGKRIEKIEAILSKIKSTVIIKTFTDFVFTNPNGLFYGIMPLEDLQEEKDIQLIIRVTTKDGSLIEYTQEFSGEFYIGQKYGGGVIFYIDDSGQHGLIAAPSDQSRGAVWGCSGVLEDSNPERNSLTNLSARSDVIGRGQANTRAIVNGCGESGIAARICDELVLNGYNDWFLPSLNELSQMCQHKDVIGGFAAMQYWSSTEQNESSVWEEDFSGESNAFFKDKNTMLGVRAVRAF